MILKCLLKRLFANIAADGSLKKILPNKLIFSILTESRLLWSLRLIFDLIMIVLAHNIYRLLASKLEQYEHLCDEKIYEKFIANNGDITIIPNDDCINIELKKKRDLPIMIELMRNFQHIKYPWLMNKKIKFLPVASS
jgi:hypothetical protein